MTLNDAVAKRVRQLLRERKMTNYRLERNSGILHGALDRILKRAKQNCHAYHYL